MIRVADIVVYDEIGQILLLAEVRTPLFSTSAEWAVGIRRHSCESLKGFLPRYFLVVARDFSYLWTAPATLNALPDVRVATEELLGEYFRRTEIDAAKIAASTLELVVGIWLRDLTNGARTAKQALPPGVDLAAAAENGRIDFPDAA